MSWKIKDGKVKIFFFLVFFRVVWLVLIWVCIIWNVWVVWLELVVIFIFFFGGKMSWFFKWLRCCGFLCMVIKMIFCFWMRWSLGLSNWRKLVLKWNGLRWIKNMFWKKKNILLLESGLEKSLYKLEYDVGYVFKEVFFVDCS